MNVDEAMLQHYISTLMLAAASPNTPPAWWFFCYTFKFAGAVNNTFSCDVTNSHLLLLLSSQKLLASGRTVQFNSQLLGCKSEHCNET